MEGVLTMPYWSAYKCPRCKGESFSLQIDGDELPGHVLCLTCHLEVWLYVDDDGEVNLEVNPQSL